MQFSDALTIARSGRALAFLGSGFSLGAISISGEKIPTAGQLAARLMNAAGESEDADFDLAADLYSKKHSDNPLALNAFLEKQFLVRNVDPTHLEFAKYPWKRIYTTNYDNVVELASGDLSIERTPVSWRSSPNEHARSASWIVHLHGFAGNLSKVGSTKEFLLGRQSYIELELLKTQWPTQLQADLAKATAIFVIGFSFNDLHIARLFRLSSSLKRKTFVIIHSTAPAALRSYAADFGTVVDCGVKGFVEELAKASDVHEGSSFPAPMLSFVEHPLPETPIEPSPKDVFDLLIAGKFEPAIYLHTLINQNKPYAFERAYALREVAAWDGTTARKFLVSSRIGNGKSLLFNMFKVRFARDGFIVCEGTHSADTLPQEIEILRGRGQPIAFFYDGLRENEASIKTVASELTPRDILLVATRPTAFATNYDNLHNVLGPNYKRINLDTLQPSDISSLDALLEFYGLWGGTAGASSGSRAQFIREECGSEPRAVLLHLFKSPEITAKINEPVRNLIALGGDVPRAFAALLIIRLADCPIGFEDICDLFDVIPADVHHQFRTAGAIDLFPDTDHEFRARSPILSEYLLSRVIPPQLVQSALRILVERLVDLKDADWRFEESIGRVLRFAIISRVFGANRNFISTLYDAILNIGYLREDPQFWLQLGMARIDHQDWAPARKALDTSYEKAKKRPGYNTYMLDNQMSRFLLGNALAGQPCDLDADALEACRLMGPRLITRSGGIDIYAFRAVEPLLQFIDTFKSRLNSSSKTTIEAMIAKAKSAIATQRMAGPLDGEEERIWRQLRGR